MHLGAQFIHASGVLHGFHLDIDRWKAGGRLLRNITAGPILECRVSLERLLHIFGHLLRSELFGCKSSNSSAFIDHYQGADHRRHLHADQHAKGSNGSEHHHRHH